MLLRMIIILMLVLAVLWGTWTLLDGFSVTNPLRSVIMVVIVLACAFGVARQYGVNDV